MSLQERKHHAKSICVSLLIVLMFIPFGLSSFDSGGGESSSCAGATKGRRGRTQDSSPACPMVWFGCSCSPRGIVVILGATASSSEDEDEGADGTHESFSIPAGPITDLMSIKRPKFQRLKTGVDLVMEVAISLQEALLGFRLAFRHLDDRIVIVESPASTVLENEAILTVDNEGMPLEHNPTRHGDLIIGVAEEVEVW